MSYRWLLALASLPGFNLPGGTVLPLNWDVFTDLIMVLLNTPPCQGFLGTLDGNGQFSMPLIGTVNANGLTADIETDGSASISGESAA